MIKPINLISIFRGLVVFMLASDIVAPIVMTAIFPQLAIPNHGLDHLSVAAMVIVLAAFVIMLVLLLGASVGLMLFKWWARIVFPLALGLSCVIEISLSTNTVSSVGSDIDDITWVCDGALLALMWASPLAERFRKPAYVSEFQVVGGPSLGRFLYEYILKWRRIRSIIVASLCATVVGITCVLFPTMGMVVRNLFTAPNFAQTMGSFVVLFAIFGVGAQYILQWAAFWILISFLIFPLIVVSLSRLAISSRWVDAGIGFVVPFLLLLVAELSSPQFKPLDFLVIPTCGGIPAALVFGEFMPSATDTGAYKPVFPAVASSISVVCLLVIAAIGYEAWFAAKQAFPIKAEWQYRAHHPTWPVLCSDAMDTLRLFPRLGLSKEEDLTTCKTYAVNGDAIAQMMTANGKFGAVSPAERVVWLTKAAAQDYGPAASALGSMLGPFSKDQGVPKDSEKAAQWELRAAISGDAVARVEVAVMYSRGDRGLPQDILASLMWRELAFSSEDNGTLANAGLRNSYKKFAATQPQDLVAEAHRRAQEFLKNH